MSFVAAGEAIVDLYLHVCHSLENLAMTYVNDRDQAIDLVQDVIVAMLEKELTFESPAACVSYMKQIVRGKSKNHLRKTSPIDLAESFDDVGREDDSFGVVDTKMLLHRLLVKYPAEIQDAFIAHVLDGETSNALASRLGVKPDTLRRQFTRIKKELLEKSDFISNKKLLFLILSVPFD